MTLSTLLPQSDVTNDATAAAVQLQHLLFSEIAATAHIEGILYLHIDDDRRLIYDRAMNNFYIDYHKSKLHLRSIRLAMTK